MNKRNRPRKKLPIRKKPIWIDANYRKLAREAEAHVVSFMRRKRWIRPTQTSFSTEASRLALLEHLPEVFAAVPDAFWSPAVYKAVQRALLMVQYPHLEVPTHGPVTSLTIQAGDAWRVPQLLRRFVTATPVTLAAAPALKAASKWLSAPPLLRSQYSDLEQLIRARSKGTGKGLGTIYDNVAELLDYKGSFLPAANGWSSRANALNRTLSAPRRRQT